MLSFVSSLWVLTIFLNEIILEITCTCVYKNLLIHIYTNEKFLILYFLILQSCLCYQRQGVRTSFVCFVAKFQRLQQWLCSELAVYGFSRGCQHWPLPPPFCLPLPTLRVPSTMSQFISGLGSTCRVCEPGWSADAPWRQRVCLWS